MVVLWDADAAAAAAAAEYNPSAAALKLAGETATAEAAAAVPYWPQTWASEEKFVIPDNCMSAAECNNEDAANAVFEATNAALLGELLLLLIIWLVLVVGIEKESWVSQGDGVPPQYFWFGDFCELCVPNAAITRERASNFILLLIWNYFDTFTVFNPKNIVKSIYGKIYSLHFDASNVSL